MLVEVVQVMNELFEIFVFWIKYFKKHIYVFSSYFEESSIFEKIFSSAH